MKTLKAQALEAVVDLVLAMSDHSRSRPKVAEALTAAISTMEIMDSAHDTLSVPHSQKNLRDRNPDLWGEAELTVWTLTCKGAHTPKEMLEDFEKFAKERLGLHLPFPTAQ